MDTGVYIIIVPLNSYLSFFKSNIDQNKPGFWLSQQIRIHAVFSKIEELFITWMLQFNRIKLGRSVVHENSQHERV